MRQKQTTPTAPNEELASLRRQVDALRPLQARTMQAEDELARFFAQSLDLLCIAGLDGFFKRLNPAWTGRLGWTLDELLATPFIDFVHPDDRVATLAEVDTLGEGSETIRFENRYRHKNGSYRWLQWNARLVPGRDRIYATARDVTRQKRQERELLEIIDREKERLGQELHDGLCQTLAGIAALSSALSRRLAATSESAAFAVADEIVTLLNATIGDARDMARGLGPIGLKAVGLDGALETLALNVQHLFRIQCTLECDSAFFRLRNDVAAHLFRIAQESVNNAVTHARADRIEISVSCKDGSGVLSVRDDGVGLSDEARHSDGIGLHTMAYRARLIGASLEVRRRSVRGTAVTCTFPLAVKSDTREKSNDVSNNN